jgi:Cu2+-exporting ATPase
VTDVVSFGDHTEDEVLRLAAGVESQSEHPIATGIIERAKQRNIDFTSAKDFKTIPGKGARGAIGGNVIKVVSVGYLEENKIEIDNYNTERLAREGKTIAYVLVDDYPIGIVALADVIRPTSQEAVKALKDFGMQVMMVTGDSEAVARSVSGELGLDDYFAQVLPDKKAEKIRQIRRLGFTVAMVGDGINDAPALVEADIGIAIGAGTDIAIESADIVLVRSDPRDVTAIVGLAKASYAKMVQNLWWAAGYNIIAVPLAAGVLYRAGIILPPAVGAVIMSLSTIIVVINARLLGRMGKKSAEEAKKTNLSQCSCASCGIFR